MTSTIDLATIGTADEPVPQRISNAHAKTLQEAAIPLHFAVDTVGIFSVARAEDLPDDISDYHYALPGLVFPLRNIDGLVRHQIRRDVVAPARAGMKAPGKYLLPKDQGSWLTIHPNQADRVGVADEIWIVEGTKQAICASFYAPDDVLVVGIQGCEGWSSKGGPLPELARLGIRSENPDEAGAKVAIMFDADRAKKVGVYEAGIALAESLRASGASEVVYADNPGRGNTGLDDYLARYPHAQRSAVLTSIANSGIARPGTKPKPVAKVKTAGTMTSKFEEGVIGTLVPKDEDDPSSSEKFTVEIHAAARIAELIQIHDPDNPDKVIAPTLKLEVSVATEAKVEKYPATVTSANLTDLGYWLDQLPNGIGVTIARTGDTAKRHEIANAIRIAGAEEMVTIDAVPRTGWVDVDGEQRYLHQGGALGGTDNVTHWRAHLPVRYRPIDFTAAATQAVEDVDALRDAVREVTIVAPSLLVDRTPWLAGLGGIAIAESGAVPNTAIGLVADKSAGKTCIVQGLTSLLSPDFAYGRTVMAVADGTANALDLAMSGLDNCFLLMDDWHPEADPRERMRQAKSLDSSLRRVHGAPSKARAMIDRQVDGVALAQVNNSHPFLLLSLEKLPDRQFAESVLDRMLTLQITKESTFLTGDARKLIDLGQSGKPQLANVGYIMWVARQIEAKGADVSLGTGGDPKLAMKEWVREVDDNRAKEQDLFSAVVSEATKRAAGVVSSIVEGLAMWISYALDIEAITEEEGEAIFTEARSLLRTAVAAHTNNAMGGNESEAIRMLRAFKSAVHTGALTLGGDAKGGQRRLGKWTTFNGESVIAILGAQPFLDYTRSDIESTLRKVAMTTMDGGKLRFTQQVSFPSYETDEMGTRYETTTNGRPRCYCIPKSVWDEA